MSIYLWKFTVRHIFGLYYWPRRLLRQLLTLLGGHLADRLRPSNKSMVHSNTESKVVSSYSIMQDKEQLYSLKFLSVSQLIASMILLSNGESAMVTLCCTDFMMKSSLKCWWPTWCQKFWLRIKCLTVLFKIVNKHKRSSTVIDWINDHSCILLITTWIKHHIFWM